MCLVHLENFIWLLALLAVNKVLERRFLPPFNAGRSAYTPGQRSHIPNCPPGIAVPATRLICAMPISGCPQSPCCHHLTLLEDLHNTGIGKPLHISTSRTPQPPSNALLHGPQTISRLLALVLNTSSVCASSHERPSQASRQPALQSSTQRNQVCPPHPNKHGRSRPWSRRPLSILGRVHERHKSAQPFLQAHG